MHTILPSWVSANPRLDKLDSMQEVLLTKRGAANWMQRRQGNQKMQNSSYILVRQLVPQACNPSIWGSHSVLEYDGRAHTSRLQDLPSCWWPDPSRHIAVLYSSNSFQLGLREAGILRWGNTMDDTDSSRISGWGNRAQVTGVAFQTWSKCNQLAAIPSFAGLTIGSTSRISVWSNH